MQDVKSAWYFRAYIPLQAALLYIKAFIYVNQFRPPNYCQPHIFNIIQETQTISVYYDSQLMIRNPSQLLITPHLSIPTIWNTWE